MENNMQALKNVGELSSLLGDTPIAQSPMWDTPLEKIHPVQLHAFLTRLKLDHRDEEGVAIVETLLAQLTAAFARGEIVEVPLMRFAIPQERMTLGELKRGLMKLSTPRPAAVLFGLEMDLPIDDLITLKWERVREFRQRQMVTPLAEAILRAAPHHIRTHYVFWQQVEERVTPLFGLSLELAEIFDMEWPQLRHAYQTIIKLDSDMERMLWLS
jgi:hypothetical protein